MIRRWFPNALIVADRFHAVRLAGVHLMRVARQLCPELGWKRAWLGVLRQRHDRTIRAAPAPGSCWRRTPAAARLRHEGAYLHWLRGLKRLAGRAAAHPAAPRRHPDPARERPQRPLSPSPGPHRLDRGRSRPHVALHTGITEGFHRKMKLIQRRAHRIPLVFNCRLRVIAECG